MVVLHTISICQTASILLFLYVIPYPMFFTAQCFISGKAKKSRNQLDDYISSLNGLPCLIMGQSMPIYQFLYISLRPTLSFIVVESFAAAQALLMRRINEESSSLALAKLLILSQASSSEEEFSISSNFDWADSMSNCSSVQSYAWIADRHLAPSLATPA